MRCAYCKKEEIGDDAMGMPACQEHMHNGDEEYTRRTGRDPNADTFEYCDVHIDLWHPDCERCKACSQHHYSMGVKEAQNTGKIYLEVIAFESVDEFVQHMFPEQEGEGNDISGSQ